MSERRVDLYENLRIAGNVVGRSSMWKYEGLQAGFAAQCNLEIDAE